MVKNTRLKVKGFYERQLEINSVAEARVKASLSAAREREKNMVRLDKLIKVVKGIKIRKDPAKKEIKPEYVIPSNPIERATEANNLAKVRAQLSLEAARRRMDAVKKMNEINERKVKAKTKKEKKP